MQHKNIKGVIQFFTKEILRKICKVFTCVWLIPKLAANSARSGSARYCVRWNLLSRCWVCNDEYIDLGFRIFLPLPLTRVVISPFSIVYDAPEIADSTVFSLSKILTFEIFYVVKFYRDLSRLHITILYNLQS